MISVVVPTRNRAHTLAKVARSYFTQALVTEIVFVNDAGGDGTASTLGEIAADHPNVRLKIIENAERNGASESRNIGVRSAENDYVLFCDDDEYLEKDYAATCLRKLQDYKAGAVSGRRVYMRTGETQEQALRRFGDGMISAPAFRPLLCEIANGAIWTGDKKLPFTNAIILTKRQLVLDYPFDGYYARGNGYREETDYQMNLFVHGFDIYATNDCHSIHLPETDIRTGGQRTPLWRKPYYSIMFTDYFYKKYYRDYAKRMGLWAPRWSALAAFSLFVLYRDFVRPPLHKTALWFLARRRSRAAF